MPKSRFYIPPEREGLLDSGRQLPYRDQRDVDKVLGTRLVPVKRPVLLEEFPLAKAYPAPKPKSKG